MALDELGSRLLRIFELADLSGEPGQRAFEKPIVRFGRAPPGMLSRLQGGGTGLETFAAAVPGDESAVGVLGATEVLLVYSARGLQVLVAGSDGSTGPSSRAGAEVGKILFEGGLLLVHVDELLGDERRNAAEELPVLGAHVDETLGGSGLVGGPLLAALVIPGPGETLRSLGEIGRGGIDVARSPGPAHGHVGKLPATAVVENVCHLNRGALGAMSSDGVAVAEAVRAEVFATHVELATVGRDRGECLGLRVDGGDPGSLRGDPGALRSWGKSDHPVPGPVSAPSGC